MTVSASTVRRRTLIKALRDPAMRPDGFEWNYNVHDSCAIGLAGRLFPDFKCGHSREVAATIGLDEKTAREIFLYEGMKSPDVVVTPEMVADLLEAAGKRRTRVPAP